MNMNKKGFTLIELIAVILILAIIALIVVPIVFKIVEEAKINAFKDTNLNIVKVIEEKCSSDILLGKEATYDYYIDGGLIIPEIGIKGKLPDNGTVFVNSDCQVSLATNNNKYCAVKYENDEQVYVGKFVENQCIIDGKNTSLYLDAGADTDYVEIGETYVIPTAVAKDIQNNDISSKVTYTIRQEDKTVENIDTSYLTDYEILYKVSANKMTVTKLKIVKVVDTTAPIINGVNDITIYSTVSSFDILDGVTATDNSGEEVDITTSGNLTLGVAGEYKIKYTATDESGNESSVTRTISVIDKTYILTLDAQGGTVTSPVTIHHDGTYGALETPIKSEYTFLGWYTDSSAGTKVTSSTSVTNANHTLYAHWTPISSYTYTGSYQTFTAALTGTYLFETWGAQGGSNGGKGAYASGKLHLNAGDIYYVFVGQSPMTSNGGYNGGGSTGTSAASYGVHGGGGATDIRITSANEAYDQKRRLIVAAGGGAGSNGGAGGVLTGDHSVTSGSSLCIDGINYANYDTGCIFRITAGGTQVSGGVGGLASVNSYPYTYGNWSQGESGSWYQGANNTSCSGGNCNWSAGGGGGWYGGGGGANTTPYSMGGGGGSSFVSGYEGCQAVNGDMQPIGKVSITGISFTDPVIISGTSSIPKHSGTGTMIGNSGDGYAKISYIP